jgi:hypothetical protein
MYNLGCKKIKSDLAFAKHKYREHKRRLNNKVDKVGNPILMKLTFEEWNQIWDESGHWEERGCKLGQYCMSRKNDIGHYEVDNVFIQQQRDNTSQAHKGTKISPGQLKKLCDGRDRYVERRSACLM